MVYTVYVHHVPNGKVYVGVTSKKTYQRWRYGHGYASNTAFDEDIQSYGWKNIQHEIVATLQDESEAYALERNLITKYDSTNPEKGYNRATGGKGTWGVQISEETRKRLSNSHTGLKQNRTPEWDEKIRKGNLGKKKPHKGVPRSAACREKVSKAHSKKVYQYDTSMNLIAEWDSARAAEKALNIRNQYISRCCNGKQATAGGYIWKFNNIMEVTNNEYFVDV